MHKNKEPMTAAEVQPTWEYLQKQERILKRNSTIYRIIRPLTPQIFAFNLLLVSLNLLLFLMEDLIGEYFQKLPLLPILVENLPRGGWTSVILFSVFLALIVPLAISGIIAGIVYYLDRKKPMETQPLVGSQTEQAEALMNKAETLYEQKKTFKRMKPYPTAAFLTAITAVIFVLMFISFASQEAMALQLALVLLALLVCVFVLFWMFALLAYVFDLLNSLYYRSDGQWSLYTLYQRIRAYHKSLSE